MALSKDLPIGIFDSGLGGLTIVKAMQALLPEEDLIYFGDTAHLPYGDKSPELVQSFALAITRFLLSQPVKAIVIACNTASAAAAQAVAAVAGEVPVFDVISPAVSEAARHSRNNRIGIIGTKTTVHSNVYRTQLSFALSGAHIVEKATPLLVPMIEEGWLHNAVSQDVIDAYMSDTGFFDIDTLILGCTHYPLIKNQIAAYFEANYPNPITVIDSSLAVANAVKAGLTQNDLLRTQRSKAHYQYFLSDYTIHFQAAAKLFLEREVVFEKKEVF